MRRGAHQRCSLLGATLFCVLVATTAAQAQPVAGPGHPAAGAGAGNEGKPAVIGILSVTSISVPEAARAKFETTIEEGVASLGYQVATSLRLGELLAGSSYVEGCDFGPCLFEIHRLTGIRLVLIARIRSFGPSYAIVLSLVDTRSGLTTSQVAQRCDVCTVDEAASQVTLGVIELATGTGDAEVADLEAGPTGSATIVDGSLELTELQTATSAGKRSLRRTGVFFAAAAVVAAAASAYFLTAGDDVELGYIVAAGAGTSLVAGTTLFVLSGRF